MTQTKIPPHSLEAEQSVIGGLMIDNQTWEDIIEILTPESFYHPAHKLMFKSLISLSSRTKPFDVITVSEELNKSGDMEKIGGETYLFEIVHNTPSAANIIAYANIVHEKSLLRQLLTLGGKISENIFKPNHVSSENLVEEIEKEIFALSNSRNIKKNASMHIKTIMPRTINKIEEIRKAGSIITGLATGYSDLDNLTSGLQRGELIIVAGRPSMGKTTFAINIAENVAIGSIEKEKKTVLVFSMEMPAEQLNMRMFSSIGKIDHQKLRLSKLNDDDYGSLGFAVETLNKTNIIINEQSALSPMELRGYARRATREFGKLDLILVDYLQLMRVPENKGNKVEEVSEITRFLKSLAKDLNIPVIAISQLNRGVESRNDKRPVMSDLRDSGSIEQDADLIIFIYRDEVYNPQSLDKGTAEIIIAKQRNGPIDKIRLTFMGEFLKFENYLSIRKW